MERITIKDALEMTPGKLVSYLQKLCYVEIPPSVESVDDMKTAAKTLSTCASIYSYLINMKLMANIQKRSLKRDGADKKLVEDALIKEEIFDSYAKMIDTAYSATSRMVTIRQQVTTELRMLGNMT